MLGYKGEKLAPFHHTNLKLQTEHISVMESYDLHSESDSEYMGRRKGRKLLAEKRRRARINLCLKEIKNIVCATQKHDPNYEKMEKAEILETTVDYLRNVRKINTTHQQVKETVQARFQQGFSRCAEEILTYIQSLPGVSDNVQHQLRKHLSGRLQQVPVMSSTSSVTSTTQHVTSHVNPWHERLGSVPPQHQHLPSQQHTSPLDQSTHAYMNLSVNTSPVRDDSFTDSGLGATPDSQKRTNPAKELLESPSVFHSGLYPAYAKKSKKTFDESRVRAWVESTWSYSQEIKLASRNRNVWRPW